MEPFQKRMEQIKRLLLLHRDFSPGFLLLQLHIDIFMGF